MKKLLTLALALAMVCVCALAAAEMGPTLNFKLAENQPDGNPITEGMKMFAELANKYTEGTVTIDVYANGAVVGRDFTKDPGLHRTMLGDGLATMAAGVLGGPPNTTYSENTAVLAATGNYNPVTLRIAALIAIVVSFFGKAIGVIETIPTCVLGGACIVLYGMISSVGLRTLVENHVDFTKNRNLCIAAVMLVLAIGEAVIGGPNFSLTNIGLGIIAGILLNLILPEPKEPDPSLIAHTVEESEIVEERK